MIATDEQRAAIDSDAPNILCIATAGSGKTATLIGRIRRLIEEDAKAQDMVAITYTVSAAAEFTARLQPEDGSVRISLGYAGPLHGYCLRHLHRHGYEGYTVLDEAEAEEELYRTAQDVKVGAGGREWFKQLKREWLAGQHRDKTMVDVMMRQYYRRLHGEKLLDYDSILYMGLESFGKHPEPVMHLFVDEFQDASPLDFDLYTAISALNRFYCGDWRQSIFSFRGGNLAPFMRLAVDPEWLKLPLTINFRSDKEIVDAADRLMSHANQFIHLHQA